MNNTIDEVRQVLADTLQLGNRAQEMTPDTGLLGSIPELDSMSVVTIITELEERFGRQFVGDLLESRHDRLLVRLALVLQRL